MNASNNASNDKLFMTKALDATIHVGLVVLLLFYCFQIGRPFIDTIVWGIIIAVAVYPAHRRLQAVLAGRGGLAAVLITVLALVLLIVPTVLLAGSLIETAKQFSAELRDGALNVPPPPESIRTWPAIGEPLYEFWGLASNNLSTALGKMAPQLKAFGSWLLSAAAGTGAGILKFVFAIIISGVLLARANAGSQAANAIAARLADDRGAEFVDLAEATVRSVTRGIVGVALIQSVLAGLGCLVVGVPGAGLWAFLVLLLAVVQLPPILVLGPIIVYVFYTASTFTAVVFAIWSILVAGCDSFLKPLLMGRGVDVPMLVIFIGAIGGFIFHGIIGLFIGAIILALGYKLFLAWMKEENELAGKGDESQTPTHEP